MSNERIIQISQKINAALTLREDAKKLHALAVVDAISSFIDALKLERAVLIEAGDTTAAYATQQIDRAGYRDGYNGAAASGPQATTDEYTRAYVEGQRDRAADARRGVPIPFERP